MGREPMQLTDELAMQVIDDLGEKIAVAMQRKNDLHLPLTPEQLIAMCVMFVSITFNDIQTLLDPTTLAQLAVAKRLAMPTESPDHMRDAWQERLARTRAPKT